MLLKHHGWPIEGNRSRRSPPAHAKAREPLYLARRLAKLKFNRRPAVLDPALARLAGYLEQIGLRRLPGVTAGVRKDKVAEVEDARSHVDQERCGGQDWPVDLAVLTRDALVEGFVAGDGRMLAGFGRDGPDGECAVSRIVIRAHVRGEGPGRASSRWRWSVGRRQGLESATPVEEGKAQDGVNSGIGGDLAAEESVVITVAMAETATHNEYPTTPPVGQKTATVRFRSGKKPKTE
jgi:hypothetical protein